MKSVNETALFEQEIIPMYADLFRYLLHLGCPDSTGKDIAQTTMEKAWASREIILYIDYKKQWLFRVAFNEYMDHLRRRAREYSYSPADTMMDEDESRRSAEDSLDIIIKQENLQRLKNALDRLDPKYSTPIRLRYFGELSHKEIADVLGLNYNTTRSVIARGLTKLKAIIIESEQQVQTYER